MFGILKTDPIKKLEKEFKKLSEQALHAQRNGKIELYSELTYKADEIYKKIQGMKENSSR